MSLFDAVGKSVGRVPVYQIVGRKGPRIVARFRGADIDMPPEGLGERRRGSRLNAATHQLS